jgi:signal transduction histidine kinase
MEMYDLVQSTQDNPDRVRDHVLSLRERASSLSEEVRGISHRLHPSILDDLGLSHALRALVEEFGRREAMIATFASRNVSDGIPREVSGVLYRIAQEALRNVAKHAGKTHVRVTLEGTEGALRLVVADLGEGFDTEGVRGGLGLISMAERARLIQGTFSVQSALGAGTIVTVEAPVPPE